MSCLFCKIIAGDIPADKVYEDEQVLAFRDINPAAPTHVLIIPKKHIETLNHAEVEDEAVLGHMMLVGQKIAAQEGVEEDGYRLVMNTNRGGGQSVYHIHLHLLAGRSLQWPPG